MPGKTKIKGTVYSMLLAGVIGFSGHAVAEQIVNGDFETGDFTGWTKTGTAFNTSPNQNEKDVGEFFSGWQNDWYVNTWFSGESAVGTLRSDTFKLTGTIDFLIAGWSDTSGGASNYNYVVLNRASDGLELARAWVPNQTYGMIESSLEAATYIGRDVYIEVVDNVNAADFAWIAVDAFSMEDPARVFENLSWDQHIARGVSPRWREARDKLKRIEGELELLPKILKEDSGGTGGLAFFMTAKPVEGEPERIIEIRWKDAMPVDLVALVPARKYHANGVEMDYGLPEDFSVELICDAEKPAYPVASESGVRSRPLQNGHPFVYPLREPVVATGLRIKVARVVKEESEKKALYVMAFAEAFCFSGNKNIAGNAEVLVNYDMGDFYHWHWRNGFLVDGQTPLELPEIPVPARQEMGWLSTNRIRDDISAWVTIDLGRRRRFDGLRIYPVRRPALGDLPGFGMPKSFQVGVSDTDSSDAYAIVLDYANRNMDNPGHNPVELRFPPTQARFVRFEALKLWKMFESYPAYLALSEIEVLNGTENIALGAHVVSSDQIGRVHGHADLVWSEESLTDGHGPDGLLVQPRAWLLKFKERTLLEAQQSELESRAASITATIRHWVFGALILLAGGGTLGSVVLPMRARWLRKREVLRVRERIAGDLHDEVGSNLGSIQILSSLAQHQMPPCDELKDIQRVAAETVAAVRDIVWFLRARTTQRICLADHLKEMGGILLESLEWSLVGDDEGHAIDISDDLLRNLMLFYREALHNIIQHAQAKSVAIRLDVTKETLSLAIADDGCGIPEEVLGRPPTLRALKYRAERLHGRLDVCSSPDSGTTVTLSFSLRKR